VVTRVLLARLETSEISNDLRSYVRYVPDVCSDDAVLDVPPIRLGAGQPWNEQLLVDLDALQ
jgi:hypothetical protein